MTAATNPYPENFTKRLRPLSEIYQSPLPAVGDYPPDHNYYFRLTPEQAFATHRLAEDRCAKCGTADDFLHECTCGGVICGESELSAAPDYGGETFFSMWLRQRRMAMLVHNLPENKKAHRGEIIDRKCSVCGRDVMYDSMCVSYEQQVRYDWGHVALLPSPDETGFVVFNNTGIRLSGPGYHPLAVSAWKAASEFVPKDSTEYRESVCWESHQAHRPGRDKNPNAPCLRCGQTWPDAMYQSICRERQTTEQRP